MKGCRDDELGRAWEGRYTGARVLVSSLLPWDPSPTTHAEAGIRCINGKLSLRDLKSEGQGHNGGAG